MGVSSQNSAPNHSYVDWFSRCPLDRYGLNDLPATVATWMIWPTQVAVTVNDCRVGSVRCQRAHELAHCIAADGPVVA